MKYKADWDEACERLTALWNGQMLERPCITVTAPSGKHLPPPPQPISDEYRWMDPSWNVKNALYHIESTWWGGETIPSYLLMCGWVVCLGGRPRFSPETIWFDEMPVDFDKEPPFRLDIEDQWFVRHKQAYMALAEAAGYDDFMVGQPVILPANDMISMLMGPENFLLALYEHPQWMKLALTKGIAAQVQARCHLADCLKGKHKFWYGRAGWMPLWGPEPFIGTQSDVSCMISPEMFVEFILPELQAYAKHTKHIWYHLDGKDARQHLPVLLSLDFLKVLQYTPAPTEPPNGPAHIEFYKEVQKAGKIVHVEMPKENVEAVLKAVDPALIVIKTHCASISEGEELLAASKRWIMRKPVTQASRP